MYDREIRERTDKIMDALDRYVTARIHELTQDQEQDSTGSFAEASELREVLAEHLGVR